MENTHKFQVWVGAAFQLVIINAYAYEYALACVTALYPAADLIMREED